MKDLEEDLNDESDEETELFRQKKIEIIDRCKSAKLEFKEDDDELFDGEKDLFIHLPSGRDSVAVYIGSAEKASKLLQIDFEKYRMLGDYVGIYSYEKNTIEAAIRPVSAFGPPASFLRRRLFRSIENDDFNSIELKQNESNDSVVIKIEDASEEFCAIYDNRGPGRSRLSLKIENSKAKTHDGVVRVLEKLSNSMFFQIDLQLGVALSLQRERSIRPTRSRRRSELATSDALKFPQREYEQQPISLYWYAKSANALPLLQFLAYFQVLEFFMPTYSNHEAVGKVRNILKDPRFSSEKDSQVARILATLRPSKYGFGDERTQLEAVIRSCISQNELRNFFESDDQIEEYYNNGYKPISDKKIPLKNNESDLIKETALRLYEIRCRIVHTKDQSEKEVQLLLPFSKETRYLQFDIALIEYIATSVLIASSTPLKAN